LFFKEQPAGMEVLKPKKKKMLGHAGDHAKQATGKIKELNRPL
jgi:hypothetical protein